MKVLLLGGVTRLAGRYRTVAAELGHELDYQEKLHPRGPSEAQHKLVVLCMSCCSHPQREFALAARRRGAQVAVIEGSPSPGKLRQVLQRALAASAEVAP